MIPAAFPPPVDSRREFIKRELDDEDERIEVGVAIVGGGPAGLACANRLLQLLADEPELMERLGEVPVAVIEKGKACGAHNLSGAMMRPSGLQALFPDLAPRTGRRYGQVDKDAVYWMLSPKRALPLKPTPPPFRNHGNYVVSVAELSRWLAEKAEEARRVHPHRDERARSCSSRTASSAASARATRAAARTASRWATSSPAPTSRRRRPSSPRACWGHLTGAAIREFDLAEGREPQVWALGVKEVWEVPKKLDRVVHTLGWPLRYGAKHQEFGGSWIYPMGDDRVSIGFVVGLDYTDATVSGHDLLQQFKTQQARARDPRGRQARRVGREGDPRGRLLGDAEAHGAGRSCSAATRAGW